MFAVKRVWISVVRRLLVAGILASLLGTEVWAADQSTPAYYQTVEVYEAVVCEADGAILRAGPDRGTERIGLLKNGETVDVIDDSQKDWVEVSTEHGRGFVFRELVELYRYTKQMENVQMTSAQADKNAAKTDTGAPAAVVSDETGRVSVEGLAVPTLHHQWASFRMTGILHSTEPMKSVTVEVFDERELEMEWSVTESLEHKEDPCTFDLFSMDSKLRFSLLTGGEKRLIARVQLAEDEVALVDHGFYVVGDNEEITCMTRECEIEVSCASAFRLYDADYLTAWVPNGEGETVTVQIPDDKNAELLVLEWNRAPSAYDVHLKDAQGNVIAKYRERNEGEMINFSYKLSPEVRSLVIETADGDSGICRLRVLEEGKVSPAIQQWEPAVDKVDLMVVSTHQDDEMLFFGGTIPYYIAQDKSVLVVYMADCGRPRYQEALEGLWSCGMRLHPIFVGYRDGATSDYQMALQRWGKETTEHRLVELIRTYQPDVIVTHDVNGEYGHNQHKITCAAVQEAVQLAKDPDAYAEDDMDAWEVKKLYIHLYAENALLMDVYDQPLDAFEGKTATEVATIGYDKHASQHHYFTMEHHGVLYDNRKYGLAYSAVGEDVVKKDLFENIP